MTRESVTIGQAKVGGAGTILYTLGLGSCVAIALWDPASRIGGLAHAILPVPSAATRDGRPERFASTAVDVLLDRMVEAGACRPTIRARLAGGASMFSALLNERGRKLGPRNVEAARAALLRAGVPMDREDVGGTHGRSVFLHVDEGRLIVSSVLYPDVIL
ncbi:MAG: chemotaxis protein CheD [Gemmatimonadetes bacterium]|nr:chemotaxis protein CheD [Gemmatimonadota bacterium]